MSAQSTGEPPYSLPSPAYALSTFTTRDANTGALELCDKTDFLSSRTDDGICLALFTSREAAESYRVVRTLAAGFQVTRLDPLELLCVLSRMGGGCPQLAVDMDATGTRGRVAGMEQMRQSLLASLLTPPQ